MNSKTTTGPLKTVDGRLLTQDTEMAEELNRSFASVFTWENSDTPPEPVREEDKTGMREEVQTAMSELRITTSEVWEQIRKLLAD
jgi:hypothetical protein